MSDYKTALETYKNYEKQIVVKPKKAPKKLQIKPDPILLKLYPDPHPLSTELQCFYLKLTEGVFGFSEQIRNESLQILATDYHVSFLAPYICLFLQTTVEINIASPNLSLLIYSVRMVKSLISNPYLNIKEQLHIIIPVVLSCVLCKKISKYNYDNHWTLRDFAAQVIATICYNFGNRINDIKRRVIKVYMRALQDPQKPISTLYGGLKGISCLGDEIVKVCIIPFMPFLSKRLYAILEKNGYLGDNSNEVKQVKKINDLILSVTGPIFVNYDKRNDGGTHYVQKYGYLGYNLFNYVKNLEKIEMEKKAFHNFPHFK